MIVAIFSPFFCETKVIETQSACCKRESGAECGMLIVVPSPTVLKNWTCSTVMIFVLRIPSLGFVVEYSHERMAKNNAPVVSVAIALCNCVSAVVMKWRQKARGRQAWLLLGGSASL